jgi:hypothetical protein
MLRSGSESVANNEERRRTSTCSKMIWIYGGKQGGDGRVSDSDPAGEIENQRLVGPRGRNELGPMGYSENHSMRDPSSSDPTHKVTFF